MSDNKKSKKKTIITVIIIVLLLVFMAFFSQIKSWFSSEPNQTAMPINVKRPPLNVNAQILKFENIEDMFRTKGLLIPDEEVDLTFETSGKITNIYFKEGTFVNKDDLLVKVNDAELQAELLKLQAELPLAKERVYRQKSLLDKDAVSKEAYESVTTALATLEAEIELVNAKIRLTELRAPFSGIIGLRMMSEGAYASPNSVISKLTKISPLKIEFSVNEKQANDIKPSTNIKFTIENDLKTYEANVYAVETSLDASTLSLKARALYPNTNGELKPGHSASIEIKLREINNTIVIPSVAAIAEMGKDIAYVYRNKKAQQVVITKGMRTASSIQVIDGLHEGDTLIVSGVMQLRSDMDVKIDQILIP